MNFACKISPRAAVAAFAAFTLATAATARAASVDGIAFFESRIRPVLIEQCYECHSNDAKKLKGGLRLDTRDGWTKGGVSGPAIVPGKPDDSLLIKGVRHWDKDFKMPPERRLAQSQINDLVEWVKLGAPDPRTNAAPAVVASESAKPAYGMSLEQGRKHWAFQPVQNPAPPAVRGTTWPRNEIDRFTLARMEQAGVTPAPDAEPRALIRRLTFDLTGLPPTLEEVENFVRDFPSSPQRDGATEQRRDKAIAVAIDRLLASRAYGERWGRHWLDVVRYADTCGNASDYPVPQAYKYRNYVIRAFNADMPFDQFIREQLAGDLINATADKSNTDRIVATGYLAIARHFGGGKGEAHLTIEDAIENMGRTFLGLSLNCARCHDHKFDPILIPDYYALYGIFSSSTFPHPGSEGMNRPANLVPLLTKIELESATKARTEKISAAEAGVKKLEAEKAALDKEPASATKKTKSAELTKAIADAKAAVKSLNDVVPWELAYAISDSKGTNARIHVRGDPARSGDEVPRGFLRILGGQMLPKETTASGRRELADWIADPKNPLTARVMVNRIWQHHFGRGLVTTPNDFGARGQAPSHPELLDYLANRFIASGWSVKAIHRLILQSHTWQLSSQSPESDAPSPLATAKPPAPPTEDLKLKTENFRLDPNNKLFWHAERHRLDAESIRDALLFVSGDLDPAEGGAHPFPAVNTWGFTQHNQFFAVYDNRLRTVYQMQQRLRKHPFLALFDGADPNSSTATREPSTTPLQSLFMMNDKFAHEQAAKFAARMQQGEPNESRQIERAFLTLYARPPQPAELQLAIDYLANFRLKLAAKKLPADQAWASLSRALLSANEFLYLD